MENNPGLLRTEKSIAVAEESLKVAKAGKGFYVSSSGGADISKVARLADSETLSARISGSIPLYTGKKLESQIKSAELEIDSAKFQYNQARDDLAYQVATAYIDALENNATKKVYLETEVNLAEHEKNIAAMYDAGATAKIDLLRAQVETSNATQDTAKSHAAYEVSLTKLATLMSTKSISNLTVEEISTSNELGELEEYISLAEEKRSDLKADELKTEQGELNIEIAKSGKRPTISADIGANLGSASRSWHVTPSASAGVSATWNVFDGGITRTGKTSTCHAKRYKFCSRRSYRGAQKFKNCFDATSYHSTRRSTCGGRKIYRHRKIQSRRRNFIGHFGRGSFAYHR